MALTGQSCEPEIVSIGVTLTKKIEMLIKTPKEMQ